MSTQLDTAPESSGADADLTLDVTAADFRKQVARAALVPERLACHLRDLLASGEAAALPPCVRGNLERNVLALLRKATAGFEWNLHHIEDREMVSTLQEALLHLRGEVDEDLTAKRSLLRQGKFQGAELRSYLLGEKGVELPRGYSWDEADDRFDRLLEVPRCVFTTDHPTGGGYFYQPAGIRELILFYDHLELSENDICCDLGGGVARPAALLSLLRGVRCISVEHKSEVHALAEEMIARNNLERVECVYTDAREFDFLRANTFVMYDPFTYHVSTAIDQKLIERASQAEQRGERVRVGYVNTGISCTLLDSGLFVRLPKVAGSSFDILVSKDSDELLNTRGKTPPFSGPWQW